ncbi:MAG: hypothetical protein PF542_01205 [Nanoarchaeota archaeon]|nr:hypothetical protein [Nanoarchaeota archaeon]
MKILKQETDKSCGVACIRSAINNYGHNFSEKDMWDKNKPFGEGDNILNPIISLGVLALKFDMNVEYIGYHPIIANGHGGKILKEALLEKSKKNFSFGKYYVDTALEFLELGGKLNIEKLNIEKIKKIIDENEFAIVEIKPAMLGGNTSINMHHKVIIEGYNEKGFKILNPSNAQEEVWDYDSFLMAFYAAIPELLIIKKK